MSTWIVLRRNGEPVAGGPGSRLGFRGDADADWRTEIYIERRELGLSGAGWLLWMVAGGPAIEGRPDPGRS